MMQEGKLKIGISACLMGLKYRYNGTSKFDKQIIDLLANKVDLIPVCPEVECGLSIPRPPMRLEASPKGTRLRVIESGEDVTEQMLEWVENKLDKLEKLDIAAFIFKARSPSCGPNTDIFGPSGNKLRSVEGLFVSMLKRRFPGITICTEEDFPAAAEYLYYSESVKKIGKKNGVKLKKC